jgi:hypothetical protein
MSSDGTNVHFCTKMYLSSDDDEGYSEGIK